MSQGPRLELSQRQGLLMTPMMQQAVQILLMSTIELQEHIETELAENPTLEQTAPEEPPTGASEAEAAPNEEAPTAEPAGGDESEAVPVPEPIGMDEPDYANLFSPEASGPAFADPDRENVIEETSWAELTLAEHLLEQLSLSSVDGPLAEAAERVISQLNTDGYLGRDAETFAEEQGLAPELAAEAIALVRSFEPSGVAARDTREGLLIQLARLGRAETSAALIVERHFDDLARNRLPSIAQALGISMDELKSAIEEIRSLEPRPGRAFGLSQTSYIVPDVIVEKIAGEYLVSLRSNRLPALRVSNDYLRMYEREKKGGNEIGEYLKKKLDSAFWLIKAIEQRQRTIWRVADAIVRHQRDFFEYGVKYLKPMTLRVVAEDLGVHESTVSRVTTQKYMQTPRGIFEFKYFFTSSLETLSGEDASARSVMSIIGEMVAGEDPAKPLSDQKLAEALKARGFSIARRTVTKYREVLEIPAARLRIKY
jgi:RNA polymerase sigma-54 factor